MVFVISITWSGGYGLSIEPHLNWLAGPKINLFARASIGFLLISAGLAKLPRLNDFHTTVESYHLIPRKVAVFLAPLVPLIEVFLGAHLLLSRSHHWSALACILLFLLFSSAIAINLVRKRNISCGCFGAMLKGRPKWSMVGRNITFAAISLVVMRADIHPHQTLSYTDYLGSILSGVGVAATIWLWDAIGDLISTHRPTRTDAI